MSKQPFLYQIWEVVQVPGGWRVRSTKTGRVFQVLLKRNGRRREIGACSCGAKASDNPCNHCEHQAAAFELIGKQWLEGHFGAGAYELQQERIRLVSALRRAGRRGYIECPHCRGRITAHDLRPDHYPPSKLPQPKPSQPALRFEPGGAA